MAVIDYPPDGMGRVQIRLNADGTYTYVPAFASTAEGSDGQFHPNSTLWPGYMTPATGTPTDRSATSSAGSANTLAAANPARRAITFQVPTSLSGGLWISWTTTAGVGTAGSYYFPPSTALVTLDVSVIGTGPISIYTTTGGVVLPATES